MNSPITEIDENTYMGGLTLNDAIFKLGPPELVQEYSNPAKAATVMPPNSILGLLQDFTANIQEIQNTKTRRDNLYGAIQTHILELIQKGDLIAFAYKFPRDLKDKPERIPADLFFSGELNWSNSELKFKNWEFTGIRLLQGLSLVMNLKAEILNSEIQKLEKPKKLNFSELDPELHIDEIKAAQFLGLSPRTLQGYRVKGGGPEFRKIGKKSIRYKIADLRKWSESNKRKNTSQLP